MNNNANNVTVIGVQGMTTPATTPGASTDPIPTTGITMATPAPAEASGDLISTTSMSRLLQHLLDQPWVRSSRVCSARQSDTQTV